MKRAWRRFGLAAAGMAAFLAVGCATAPKSPPAAAKEDPIRRAENASGVEVVALRQTAAGRILDFRFRVVDPEKAKAVLDRGTAAHMVDETTGVRMEVPVTKVGKWRQTTLKPEKGRIYFMLFNAAGRRVNPEDTYTVIVGQHRFENLTVQ